VTTPLDSIDLDNLSGEVLAQLGAVLTARAAERRRVISDDEARAAFDAASLTPAWSRSRLADIGRLRIATHNLVTFRRQHPEQVERPLTELGFGLGMHPAIAREAVAHGVADALAEREAP
jgi:hypothetical protein